MTLPLADAVFLSHGSTGFANRGAKKISDDQEEVSNEDVRHAFTSYLETTYGSAARAWRLVLDPLGHGELLLSEFVQGLARTSWRGNTPALWSALSTRALESDGEDGQVLMLRSIDSAADRCLEEFRSWSQERFGGPIDMFTTLAVRANSSMDVEEFTQACRDHEFHGDPSIVSHAMDVDDDGILGILDAAYYEVNALKRRAYLDPDFVMDLERARKVADKWKQRRQWQRQVADAALKEFHVKVRASSGGSLIRGWRILDIYGNLTVSKVELLKGCQKMAFTGNVGALWKALDKDDDGAVQLEDVDPRLAFILSLFRKWACDSFGSCTKAMQHMAMLLQRRHPKWLQQDLIVALHLAKFPSTSYASLKQVGATLHEAMDVRNVGYITVQDAEFLDRWEPTPWLHAAPDEEGMLSFITALRERYASSLVVGWRRLLDKSGTNRVFYKDFRDTCRLLDCGNPPGIWRCFYKGIGAGFITLADVDRPSAVALLNFKRWAEESFGGIIHAFRSIDIQRSNALSYQEFRRALRKYGYKGDAKSLFLSLKPDVQGWRINKDARLTASDLKYLTLWELGDESSSVEPVLSSSPKGSRSTRLQLPASPSASATTPEDDRLRRPGHSGNIGQDVSEAIDGNETERTTFRRGVRRSDTPFWDDQPRLGMTTSLSTVFRMQRAVSSNPSMSRTPSCQPMVSSDSSRPLWPLAERKQSEARGSASDDGNDGGDASDVGSAKSGNASSGAGAAAHRRGEVDDSQPQHGKSGSFLPPLAANPAPAAVQHRQEGQHEAAPSVVIQDLSLQRLPPATPPQPHELQQHQGQRQCKRQSQSTQQQLKQQPASSSAQSSPRIQDFLSYCKTVDELKFVSYERPTTDSFSLRLLLEEGNGFGNTTASSWTSRRSSGGGSRFRSTRSPYGLPMTFANGSKVGGLSGLSTGSIVW